MMINANSTSAHTPPITPPTIAPVDAPVELMSLIRTGYTHTYICMHTYIRITHVRMAHRLQNCTYNCDYAFATK